MYMYLSAKLPTLGNGHAVAGSGGRRPGTPQRQVTPGKSSFHSTAGKEFDHTNALIQLVRRI